MKFYLLLALISAIAVSAHEEDHGHRPRHHVANTINDYFRRLAERDPFHIEYINQSYAGWDAEVYNASSDGFSNVHIIQLREWKRFSSYNIHLELNAPRISSSVDAFVINGPDSTIEGSSSVQLENLSVRIDAQVNRRTHKLTHFNASFHLERGNASISLFYNGEDISQNVTDNANNFLNGGFNNDRNLQRALSDHLRERIESHLN